MKGMLKKQAGIIHLRKIYDFIESGVMEIPNFQRNYVWDLKRASKLIESIIMGLPVPQIFLFEKSRNKFLVIDGQQRLMTIYYFIKKRFPKRDKRAFIGRVFDKNKGIPDETLFDNTYFDAFNLYLPSDVPGKKNILNGLNYSTLGEDYKTMFELRTIRNVIIKQNIPPGDDSSIYEIFNRLNSGGMNLKPQEIRYSLYNSRFYDLLYTLNQDERWRKILGTDEDIHLKDIEILLRAFALLIDGYENYKPSMLRFLNNFSKKNSNIEQEKINYLEKLFDAFLKECEKLNEKIFFSRTGKFNISMFEAIFASVCEDAFKNKNTEVSPIDNSKLKILKEDQEFFDASQSETASKKNVIKRVERAKAILFG
jgi:uncharacterized protein with ParB-like and HNH nuclease domain